MAILKQEITTRGIQGGIAPPDDETTIVELDGVTLLEIQATFGHLLMDSPRLTALVNNLGPILFATLLFTTQEEYRVSDDGEEVIPTKDVFEAEAASIGLIRSVAAAMGKLSGDVSVEPTESEVDQDTDLVGVTAER